MVKKIFEVTNVVIFYRRSKIEGLVWLITFSGVIIFDVDIGLYIGVVANLLLIIVKSQRYSTKSKLFSKNAALSRGMDYKNSLP
jgi:MFS superfamily sulfate permease-like transporter